MCWAYFLSFAGFQSRAGATCSRGANNSGSSWFRPRHSAASLLPQFIVLLLFVLLVQPLVGCLLSWAGFTSPCQNIGCPPPLPSLLPRPPNECFQQRCTTISQLPRGTIALTAPKRYNSVSTTQESACRQRVFELKLGKKVFRARSNLRGRSLRSPLSLPMIVFLHSFTSPNKLLLFKLLCFAVVAQKEEHLSLQESSTNKFLSPKYHTYFG